MAETQMIPFNSDYGWGDAVPAFGGALIGSLFTNGGFGNWSWGRNGGFNSPAGAAAETIVLDGLSNITAQLGNVNTTLLNSHKLTSFSEPNTMSRF